MAKVSGTPESQACTNPATAQHQLLTIHLSGSRKEPLLPSSQSSQMLGYLQLKPPSSHSFPFKEDPVWQGLIFPKWVSWITQFLSFCPISVTQLPMLGMDAGGPADFREVAVKSWRHLQWLCPDILHLRPGFPSQVTEEGDTQILPLSSSHSWLHKCLWALTSEAEVWLLLRGGTGEPSRSPWGAGWWWRYQRDMGLQALVQKAHLAPLGPSCQRCLSAPRRPLQTARVAAGVISALLLQPVHVGAGILCSEYRAADMTALS